MCDLVITSNRKEILCQIYLLMQFVSWVLTPLIKLTQVTQVWLWERLRWLIASLQNNFVSIQLNQTGLTVTALFFQQVMVQCSFMPFFTFLVLKMSAWMKSRASVNGVQKHLVTQNLAIQQGLMLRQVL